MLKDIRLPTCWVYLCLLRHLLLAYPSLCPPQLHAHPFPPRFFKNAAFQPRRATCASGILLYVSLPTNMYARSAARCAAAYGFGGTVPAATRCRLPSRRTWDGHRFVDYPRPPVASAGRGAGVPALYRARSVSDAYALEAFGSFFVGSGCNSKTATSSCLPSSAAVLCLPATLLAVMRYWLHCELLPPHGIPSSL